MAADAVLVGKTSAAGSSLASSSGTTTTGSTFIIGLSYDAGATRNTLVDSKSNSYTQCGTTLTNSGAKLELWRCANGTGGASHTATATFNTNAFGTIYLIEVTGAATASFDLTTQGTDAASPYTISTGTLAQANNVIITIIGNGDGTNPMNYASSNTTILSQEGDGSNFWTSAISKLVVSSTSSATPSFTSAAAVTHALITVVIKDATAGGGGGGVSPRPLLLRGVG